MTQYIHLDTETTGNQINGDILSLTAIRTDENMQPIGEEFDVLAKPRKSRAYDVDAYLVNNIDPFVADTHPLTNFQLTKKFQEVFINWSNEGPTLFNAYNGYQFDFLLMSHHLYSNLYTWPWIFSTGNAKQIDLLPITQTIDYYEPNKIATELNSKSNKVYKLASLCEKNNFPIKDSHTSRGDTEGLINLNKHLIKMSPELFKESLKFVNRKDVQPFLKKEEYFTFTETWGGKTRQYTGTYIGEHCIYKGYHLVWDNRHDAETIFSEKPSSNLNKKLFSAPKKIRQIREGKNPLLRGKAYSKKNYKGMNNEYKEISLDQIEKSAKYIISNREEILNRTNLIIEDQFKEKNLNQTDLLPEQMIFSLNPRAEQKSMMDSFVNSSRMEDKLKIVESLKKDDHNAPIRHLAEIILFEEYDNEAFDKKDYKKLRKRIANKLLSTNKESFPTIPEAFARIDTLRIEVEKSENKERKEKIENINNHLEKLQDQHLAGKESDAEKW